MGRKKKVETEIKADTLFEVNSSEDILRDGPYTPEELSTQENKMDYSIPPKPPIVPSITSQDWTDYVLSQFEANELYEGNPTLDGLRRVGELLIGEIVSSRTSVVQCACLENEKRATVICSITFMDGEGNLKIFDGAADSNYSNTEKVYNRYPTSIAESRAECRALRKALRLKAVAQEELCKEEDIEVSSSPTLTEGNITQNQLNYLDILCKNDIRGLNIDIAAFVKENFADCEKISLLTHDQALQLITKIQAYQKDKNSIPATILGYKENWKTLV